MSEQSEGISQTGRIQDIGMLDLRSAKTVEDLAGIKEIQDVGMILVPEHLMHTLTRISIQDVGAVIPVPQGENIHVMSGQVRLAGEALAGGKPEDILIFVGDVFITTPVTSVGYKELRLFGKLTAPRGSQGLISAKMTQLNGEVFYLPDNARTLTGRTEIGQAFLELFSEPTPLIVNGELYFEADVTVEQLRAKIPEIVLQGGSIQAPKALLPLLQFLTQEKNGEILERTS